MDFYHFISLLGIFCLILFAWCLSSHKNAVNWHIVVWGVGLQML
ncbi:MAG: hypothetical protein KC713_10640, partial [Candidatus Omnitrophica bacterium]|nr:hypothetical protein [Candidatus Omnitrophota bacterium]